MNGTSTDIGCQLNSDIMIATLANTCIAIGAPVMYALRKYMRARCKQQCNISIDSEIEKKTQPNTVEVRSV